MDRASLKGKIQTVLGPIAPGALGPTLMHEHLLCDINSPALALPREPEPELTLQTVFAMNYGRVKHFERDRLNSKAIAIKEMQRLKEAGGRGLCELTNAGTRPDPAGVREIAKATGVHVILGCGYYVEEFQAGRTATKTADDFARDIVGQVLEGAWGTDVRAGIIGEIGCAHPWTDVEKRVMQGAAVAQAETGAAITAHPGAHPDQPQEIVAFLRRAGADLSRVIIGHIDRTIFDEDRLLKLAGTGCTVEYDFFGMEKTYWPLGDVDLPNDGIRLKFIRTLIQHGHLGQIVVSHDICRKNRLVAFGGHGYGHIFENVLPLMRSRGFTDGEIDAILIDNPRRLLTIQ